MFELSNLLLNVSLTRRPLSERGQPGLGRTAERQAILVAMLATTLSKSSEPPAAAARAVNFVAHFDWIL